MTKDCCLVTQGPLRFIVGLIDSLMYSNSFMDAVHMRSAYVDEVVAWFEFGGLGGCDTLMVASVDEALFWFDDTFESVESLASVASLGFEGRPRLGLTAASASARR